MSNVINFNAGEFKFDKDCEPAGSRLFVTDFKGNTVQCFEIGDWEWAWSQIRCDRQLEPNTDYVFRFAVQGGVNNTGDGQSHFMIIQDDDFANRVEFPLERSRYKPVVSKTHEDGFLRVYEIPFNSGSGNVAFVFTAQHFMEAIMPAYEAEEYAELEDQTYAELWQEIEARKNSWGKFCGDGRSIDLSGAVIDNSDFLNRLMDLAERGVSIDLNRLMDLAERGVSIDLSGAVFGEQ